MSLIPLHIHTFLRESFKTKKGAFLPPEKVPTKQSKIYPRMEKVSLSSVAEFDALLHDTLLKRQSCKEHSQKNLTIEQCGVLFSAALKQKENGNRPYPSGGALYPIETYLITQLPEDNTELTAYHYQPKEHVLEKLWGLPNVQHADFVNTKDTGTALIVLTAQWHKNSAKYGDYAYNLALLEAGHLAQNILLVSTALELRSRPFAGFCEDTLSEALDLDEHNEQVIYTITLSA